MELHRTPLYRLPVNVVPVNYHVTLRPDCKNFRKFDANLAARIKVAEACNEILMHAVKLNLKEVEFKMDNNKSKCQFLDRFEVPNLGFVYPVFVVWFSFSVPDSKF